jgi:hypothetical protein
VPVHDLQDLVRIERAEQGDAEPVVSGGITFDLDQLAVAVRVPNREVGRISSDFAPIDDKRETRGLVPGPHLPGVYQQVQPCGIPRLIMRPILDAVVVPRLGVTGDGRELVSLPTGEEAVQLGGSHRRGSARGGR